MDSVSKINLVQCARRSLCENQDHNSPFFRAIPRQSSTLPCQPVGEGLYTVIRNLLDLDKIPIFLSQIWKPVVQEELSRNIDRIGSVARHETIEQTPRRGPSPRSPTVPRGYLEAFQRLCEEAASWWPANHLEVNRLNPLWRRIWPDRFLTQH